ncbi:indolepyruvate ferredoxin oxidoreductase [compost metagenome]
MIGEYEATVELLLKELKPGNYATAVALAELPEQIRGYGPVKERALAKVREQEKQLRARLTASEIQVLHLFDPAA